LVEVSRSELKLAVERTHGGTATFVHRCRSMNAMKASLSGMALFTCSI
jgi:hypothetical protein